MSFLIYKQRYLSLSSGWRSLYFSMKKMAISQGTESEITYSSEIKTECVTISGGIKLAGPFL